MMWRGVWVSYGDVAPEAKENFSIDVSENQFDTLDNLQRYNMQLYNYANPCELYQTLLDGSAVAFPDNSENANIGLWSKQLSNNDGTFTEPIAITLLSEGLYSSQGFTFTFDKFNNIYPTRLRIQWLRVSDDDVEELSDMEFNPDSSMFFCKNQVEAFNQVIVTFYSLNMPFNRLKVEVIDYGYATVFYGDELRNVKLAQYIDPISSEIKISTCDLTLDSRSDIVYSFQSKQSLTVGFNDKMVGTFFVNTSKRKARFLWDIHAEDYIGLLENTIFVGGVYTNISATTILIEIFNTAKVPYYIAEEFNEVKLSGHIPYTTCRDALMQVCFALMAVVNTANTDVVEVYSLEYDIKQIIPLSRIMQDQSFEHGDSITKIELTAHTYSNSRMDRAEIYNASDSGPGENILIKFSEPMHTLTITDGEIINSGANYAYINADESCVLKGYKYNHNQQIVSYRNPIILAGEKDNVKSITNATLVSSENVHKVLNNCYNWLTKVDSINSKILVNSEQQDINPGEFIEVETEYLGNLSGLVVQQSFNLNGNVIVKEVVLK